VLCHIFKGSVGYLYVMILPCILVMRHQHIQHILCILLPPPIYGQCWLIFSHHLLFIIRCTGCDEGLCCSL
jgi:hypothetical protein